MRNFFRLSAVIMLAFVAGCNDTCHDTPTENPTVDPEPVVEETDVRATVTMNLSKLEDFRFTAKAEADQKGAALVNGTWNIRDHRGQPVHSETGLQITVSLVGTENQCDTFTVKFTPTCAEGYSCSQPRDKDISWPDAEACKSPLFVNFSATNTSDIGDFRIFFTNLSSKGDAARQDLSCEWFLGDPSKTDGGRTQDCGFNGISHTYQAAGTTSVRLCVTHSPTKEEICKAHEVTIDP